MLARELRTARERTLFTVSAIFSSLCWLVLVVSIAGIVPILALGLLGLVAKRLFMAHVIGNGVRVGPRQLPDLMRRIEAAAHKLGLDRVPDAYVLQAGGVLHAFAAQILSRRFIVIHSALLEACDTDDGTGRANELDFVIGHELGQLAAGHLATRLFLLPARLVPLLGPAYARACTYTCDRCGHAATGDVDLSARALTILAAGPRAGRRIDIDAYIDQRRDTGRFWMGVCELNASRPFLPARAAALRARHGQTALDPVRRNPLSYLFAPFLGFLSGSPQSALLVAVIFIGVAAAVVIPKIKQQMGMGAPSAEPSYRYDTDKDPFPAPERSPDR